MIKHFQLQTLIRRISHHSDHRSLKSDVMHPQRDWLLGLVGAFVLLGGVGIISWQLFAEANSVPELTAEEVDTAVAYRQSLVERALTEYRDLAAEYDVALRSGQVVLPPTQAEIDIPATTTIEADAATTSTTTPDQLITPNDDEASATTTELESETAATSSEMPILSN